MKIYSRKILVIISFFIHQCPIFSANQVQFESNQKHVIGNRIGGFFFCFINALRQLEWCEKNNRIPIIYWDESSYYYVPEGFNGSKNVWEYYFEPVSEFYYMQDDLIHKNYTTRGIHFYHDYINKYRDKAHRIIKKYIKIKPIIQKKIDAFYEENMAGKKTVGIHLRGTDKKTEVPAVPISKIIRTANQYSSNYQFLIASDDQRLFDQAKSMLKGPVIYYDSYKSDDGKPIHRKKPCNAQLGEDVLVEAQLLARCDILIHTISNVSTAVLFFNPQLQHILLTN